MTFEVPGKPFGKARPRFWNNRVINPSSNSKYESAVRKAYIAAAGMEEPSHRPVSLYVSIGFEVPKRASKKDRAAMLAGIIYPDVRPDIDNCVKSVMDGLNGIAYCDDKQVVVLISNQHYVEEPKTIITLEEL